MYKVYGSAEYAIGKPVEAFKFKKSGSKVTASAGDIEKPVETRWIKSCAEAYNISDDISDYIIVPVPIVTVAVPNRNLQAFPLDAVTAWSNDEGRIAYQTFIGKPLHLDHKNDNPKEAKGVILDSVMRYVPKYDLWKIIILTAWCRTKDKDVANHILKDPKSEYSMGSYVKKFIEFPSGRVVKPDSPRGFIDKNGNLVYHNMGTSNPNETPKFFETSLVLGKNGAADFTAVNNQADILIKPGETGLNY